MSIALRIINQKTIKLELIQGRRTDGKPFWAFVLISTDTLEMLKPKFKEERIQLEKYGLVLEQGIGEKPSVEIRQKVFRKLEKMKV